MSAILVTGATGFIGSALVPALADRGHRVTAALRRPGDRPDGAEATVVIGDMAGPVNWDQALSGIEVVIHLAARVHVMNETEADPLAAFRRLNTQPTLALAEAAARQGVRRLVYLSSIKVNGEGTAVDRPYRPGDAPAPVDPYGRSKLEAETGLREIAARTGLEVVMVRPPLVYGPGVGGNFRSLLRLCDRAWPLPLGCVGNRRSLVYLGNLVDAVAHLCDHPEAAGRTCLVSDGEPVSTPELIRRIARALQRPARLLPTPPWLLRLGGRLTGRTAMVQRLLDSLVVDDPELADALGWTPPFTLDQGLAETAAWYRTLT